MSDPRIYADLQGAPTAFLSEAEATLYANGLRIRVPLLNDGRRSLDSVLSEGIYEVEVIEAATLPTFYPEY